MSVQHATKWIDSSPRYPLHHTDCLENASRIWLETILILNKKKKLPYSDVVIMIGIFGIYLTF